jgi:gliding motility-associated protein GldE
MFADPGIIAMIVGLVVLILCSAFASGSETALLSLKSTDIDNMVEKGDKRVGTIQRLLAESDYTLASILIINNLVNICIVILSARIITDTIRFTSAVWEFVFTSVVVTFILLLFGEIMPKVFATYNNRKFARFCAPVILGLTVILKPVAWLLVKSSSRIKGRSRENLSIDQLSDALDVTQAQSEEEKQILEGIVNFVGRDVGQVMKSRLDVIAIDIEDNFVRVKEVIVQSGFSRIPIYEENIDHIKGILYIKDVVPYIQAPDDFEWSKLIREPYFVPEHKKIDDLLEEFQTNKVHIAIVVDEYGSTLGLVSLEDILEEIVGEISDESDRDTSFFTRIGEGQYIFEGKTHLGDFERVLGLEDELFDDVKGDAETLAGLMLEVRRGFLRKGETVECKGFRFTVLSLDGRRIEKIKVVVPTPTHE